MDVGSVKKIITAIKEEFAKTNHERSKQLIKEIEDLFIGLAEDSDITQALGDQIKNIIATFWHEQSQIPVVEDWDNNETVSTWIRLQTALQETKWDIQRAHHGYFYHCLQYQYNQAGDGLINLDRLMPILIRLCRGIGYADRGKLAQYPLCSLQNTIDRIEKQKMRQLIDGFTFTASAFTILFYILYHHCSQAQLVLLPSLITFRKHTTDEEVRSETALLETMLKTPSLVLDTLKQLKFYIDGRSFAKKKAFIEGNPTLIDDCLSILPDSLPKSKRDLITATTGKHIDYLDKVTGLGKHLGCIDAARDKRFLHFGIIHKIRSTEPEHLCDSFAAVLKQEFALHSDQSYPKAISFALSVNTRFSDLPQSIQELLFSASYIFALGQYINLCESNKKSPLLWFCPKTKSNAAAKLIQQEKGKSIDMGVNEWAATHEGRLCLLKSQFEEYKKELFQETHHALIA